MKNITISIDDETYRRARIRAAGESTSVSAVVKKFLVGFIGGGKETEFQQLQREEQELRAELRERLGEDSLPSTLGVNPLTKVSFKKRQVTLADVVPLKTPSGADSKAVYASIASNIEAWIEEAIPTTAVTAVKATIPDITPPSRIKIVLLHQ